MQKRNITNYEIIIILLLLASVFMIIFPTIRYVEFADRADEGYYFRYAYTIANKGLVEFRNLFTGYIQNKENWVYPNPLRVGSIFITSLWFRLFGSSFLALAYLSFLSYLLFVIINYIFCSRVFDRETARNLSFLIIFSPLNMAMSRRALSDSLTTLFLGLSIWLFLEMIYKDKGILKRILFLAAFTSSILIKETCALLAIPFSLFLIIYKTRFKAKVKWSNLLYLLVYPAIIILPVYLLSSGSMLKIIEVARVVSSAVESNRYAVFYGAGPWFRYLIDFMLLSPWILVLAIGYVFYLAAKLEKIEIREGYFLTILLVTFFLFNFLTKNIRYIMFLDLPLRLFAVLMLKKITERISPRVSSILTFGLVALISLSDYINFSNLFLENGIYDPITFWLLKFRGIIP